MFRITCLFILFFLTTKFLCGQEQALTHSFKKQFYAKGLFIDPSGMAASRLGGFLLSGNYFTANNTDTISKTTCIISIDSNGCIQWAAGINKGRQQVIQSITATRDGGYLFTAFPYQAQTANYPTSLTIFKIDGFGNLEWSNTYSAGKSVNNYLSAVTETEDGYVIGAGSFPLSNQPSFLFLLKINYRGNVIWAHKLAMKEGSYYSVGGVTEKNGFIYITGSIYESIFSFTVPHSYYAKVDPAGGQILWTKKIETELSPLTFNAIYVFKNGLAMSGYDADLVNHIIYTDTEGNVINGMTIRSPDLSYSGKGTIVVNKDNTLFFHLMGGTPEKRKEVFMKIDSNLNIVWQKDFHDDHLPSERLIQMCTTNDNGIAAMGSSFTESGLHAISLLKADQFADDCFSINTNFTISPFPFTFVASEWTVSENISVDVKPLDQQKTLLDVDARLLCPKYQNSCDSLQLRGPAIVCNINDIVKYEVVSNASCRDSVKWSFDSVNISVINANNVFLNIQFRHEGLFTIKTERKGCNTVTDSVIVSVGAGSSIHLPKDTVLCDQQTLVLDAGKGYKSYHWNNGSSNETIRVSSPGIYWVRLISGDGCDQTDTVNIDRIVARPSHFLPADTIICSNSPLKIQPLGKFISFLWNTHDTSSVIEVSSAGNYFLQVLTVNGCMGVDSIQVGVKNCPNNISFPNVFTPNDDGRNDQFKPKLVGFPLTYRLMIFNRAGRRIFSSKNWVQGWDGRVSGENQSSGVYVWVCTYQFAGNKQEIVKGNFVLMR